MRATAYFRDRPPVTVAAADPDDGEAPLGLGPALLASTVFVALLSGELDRDPIGVGALIVAGRRYALSATQSAVA